MLIMKENNEKVIYGNFKQEKEGNAFTRKAKVFSNIVGKSVALTLESEKSWSNATFIGVLRGLYKWDAKEGLKGAAVTMGVYMAINVIGNVANNIDKINEA